MSKKTKTFMSKKRHFCPPKKVLSTDNLPPHNTPKNDRKVHSLNNAVVFVLLPKANPTKKALL